MAEKLDQDQVVTFEELLWANMYQTDALAQLLIENGIITKQEFYQKIKDVQLQYPKNARA